MKNYTYLAILLTIILQETRSSTVTFSKDTTLWRNFKVNQCRQKCYLESLETNNIAVGTLMNFNTCHKNPDCYMCYDYCQALSKAAVDLAQSMCSDEMYCSKGCRIACQYHNIHMFNHIKYQIVKN